MLMGTNSTTSVDTSGKYSALLGASGAPQQSDAEKAQDRFLKLLVAQLNNQDPMNPMDNAQMTTQMAQINTVSGIQQLNDTVKSLTGQFSTMQMAQSATMIGREVMASGNTVSIDGGVGKGAFELTGSADKVTVQVLTPGGQPLGSIELGAQTAGKHSFTWNVSGYSGSASPIFKVSAIQGNKGVAATTLVQSPVQSIGTNAAGALALTLKNGTSVGYDSIKAVL